METSAVVHLQKGWLSVSAVGMNLTRDPACHARARVECLGGHHSGCHARSILDGRDLVSEGGAGGVTTRGSDPSPVPGGGSARSSAAALGIVLPDGQEGHGTPAAV
ncbi:unnamed protein product [Gadus morhua 'NCC']